MSSSATSSGGADALALTTEKAVRPTRSGGECGTRNSQGQISWPQGSKPLKISKVFSPRSEAAGFGVTGSESSRLRILMSSSATSSGGADALALTTEEPVSPERSGGRKADISRKPHCPPELAISDTCGCFGFRANHYRHDRVMV